MATADEDCITGATRLTHLRYSYFALPFGVFCSCEGGDTEGWSERRQHDSDSVVVAVTRYPSPAEPGHDGGGVTDRKGAARRRYQGEDNRRQWLFVVVFVVFLSLLLSVRYDVWLLTGDIYVTVKILMWQCDNGNINVAI